MNLRHIMSLTETAQLPSREPFAAGQLCCFLSQGHRQTARW